MAPVNRRPHPYHHCGPFNSVLSKGSNAVDSACRRHDIDYGRIGSKAYFYYNKADSRFIKDMSKEKGFRPWFYGSVFKAKRLFAPSLPEKSSLTPQTAMFPYTPPSSSKRKRLASVFTRRMRPRRLFTSSRRRLTHAVRKRRTRRRSSRPSAVSRSRGSVKVPRRNWRRTAPRQRILSKFQNSGLIATYESGISNAGLTTTESALLLGHGTWPYKLMSSMFWKVMVKLLFSKRDVPIPNYVINTAPPDGTLSGDVISVSFRTGYNAAAISVGYTITGTTILRDISDFFENSFNTTYNNNETIFDSFTYTDTATGVVTIIRMNNIRVSVNVKSAFKMQNQTTFPSDSDIDVVNNVPVFGKVYEGYGTGTRSNRDANGPSDQANFVIDDLTGIFNMPISNVTSYSTGLGEAPPPSYFPDVKKFSKIHLDAGQLKTSVLTHRKTYSISDFTDKVFGMNTVGNDYIKTGKFRFFHFEHILKASASYPSIVVHGEHNLRIAMRIFQGQRNRTDELVPSPVYSTY